MIKIERYKVQMQLNHSSFCRQHTTGQLFAHNHQNFLKIQPFAGSTQKPLGLFKEVQHTQQIINMRHIFKTPKNNPPETDVSDSTIMKVVDYYEKKRFRFESN